MLLIIALPIGLWLCQSLKQEIHINYNTESPNINASPFSESAIAGLSWFSIYAVDSMWVDNNGKKGPVHWPTLLGSSDCDNSEKIKTNNQTNKQTKLNIAILNLSHQFYMLKFNNVNIFLCPNQAEFVYIFALQAASKHKD